MTKIIGIVIGFVLLAAVCIILFIENDSSAKSSDDALSVVPSEQMEVSEKTDADVSTGEIAAVEQMAAKTTTITIPLIRTDQEEHMYDPVVNFFPIEVPYTKQVLNAVYTELFALQPGQYQETGYYNPIRESWDINFEKVTLQNGHARVYLTGQIPAIGDFDQLLLTKPLEQAALQFDSVNEVTFYLNGEVFDLCVYSLKAGCDEPEGESTPWHATK